MSRSNSPSRISDDSTPEKIGITACVSPERARKNSAIPVVTPLSSLKQLCQGSVDVNALKPPFLRKNADQHEGPYAGIFSEGEEEGSFTSTNYLLHDMDELFAEMGCAIPDTPRFSRVTGTALPEEGIISTPTLAGESTLFDITPFPTWTSFLDDLESSDRGDPFDWDLVDLLYPSNNPLDFPTPPLSFVPLPFVLPPAKKKPKPAEKEQKQLRLKSTDNDAAVLATEDGTPQVTKNEKQQRPKSTDNDAAVMATEDCTTQVRKNKKQQRLKDDGTPLAKKKQKPQRPKVEDQEVKTFVDAITDKDVLFGRGGATNCHPGNVFYRDPDIRATFRDRYVNSSTHAAKQAVVDSFVEFMKSDGRRFLAFDSTSEKYFIVDKEYVLEKVKQFMRDFQA